MILHNGIVLPEVWPQYPVFPRTQGGIPIPYQENPPVFRSARFSFDSEQGEMTAIELEFSGFENRNILA